MGYSFSEFVLCSDFWHTFAIILATGITCLLAINKLSMSGILFDEISYDDLIGVYDHIQWVGTS